MAVTNAIDVGTQGQIADGYACLLWGLHRAEEMLEAGEPWGEELRARWQLACDNYVSRHGVPLD